ncbi:tetratricopeptide repeat protein [Amycolatopsis sp. Hca4]|uniref:tetratricopeptide repeat protein n=1 Tax=Amycolatopsis sp. Hca4 TaxID=2742131 RepID=UPI001590970F|nr:tetratricopeptide repeat protein [Amycolatopsis sp. Hca4]QKV73771.1 tetratricopeptide repeat protein [Amycolatopsis sp. Hca4]
MGERYDGPGEASNEASVDGDVSGMLVQIGSVRGDLHLAPAVRPRVQLPHRTPSLPRRATAFQPRAAAAELDRILDDNGTAVLTSSAQATTGLMSGLGGVGKTQLALDYAERAWAAGAVDLLVWVTTASRDAVVTEYAALAAGLTGFADLDAEQGAERFLTWLATAEVRWLIVLDDLQHPRDLERLWPPANPHGRVLVTTRRADAALRGPHRQLINLEVFTPAEAHAYLHDTLAEHQRRSGAIEALAETLGYLPLALAQATTYMLDRDLSCTEYLSRWHDRRNQLAALFPEPDCLPDGQHATIATTWSLSIDHANRLQPAGLAKPLLEIASVLDPNGIPAAALTSAAVTTLLGNDVDRRVTAEHARDGLACLRRLNLVSQAAHPPIPTVRVHTLVQRTTRDALTVDRHATIVRTVADALSEIWPDVERDAELGQILRTNATALLENGSPSLWEPHAHEIVFRIGGSLGNAGQVKAAYDYFRRLHVLAHDNLGPDHPDTLSARNYLARSQGEAGDETGAADAFEQLLTDHLRVLGPNHPHTLAVRNNLAYRQGTAGDVAGAAEAFEQLLADACRVLGPDHPHTLGVQNNLARFRGRAGHTAATVDAYEKVLADHLRVLGPDDPETLTVRHNLACYWGQGGDPTRAANALELLLFDRLRVLGPDHPDTLVTRTMLARWRAAEGDPAGSADTLERLLADIIRVLGTDHPLTSETRDLIAQLRAEAQYEPPSDPA